MSKPLHPILKWAQRKRIVFLEIGIRDIKNEKVQLKDKSLRLTCQNAEGNTYQFDIQFYAQVDPSSSKWSKTGFHMNAAITKKNSDQPYWPRLTANSGKNPYIQCDWEKWIDQDQENEEGSKGLAGYDPQNMQNFNDSDDQEQEKKGKIDDLQQDEPMVQDPTGSSA